MRACVLLLLVFTIFQQFSPGADAIACARRGDGYKCVLKGTCSGTVEGGGCCPKTECCAPMCMCPLGYQVLTLPDGTQRCYTFNATQDDGYFENKDVCNAAGAMLYCPQTLAEHSFVYGQLNPNDYVWTCYGKDNGNVVNMYNATDVWPTIATPPFGMAFGSGNCVQISNGNFWFLQSCTFDQKLLCQKECFYGD